MGILRISIGLVITRNDGAALPVVETKNKETKTRSHDCHASGWYHLRTAVPTGRLVRNCALQRVCTCVDPSEARFGTPRIHRLLCRTIPPKVRGGQFGNCRESMILVRRTSKHLFAAVSERNAVPNGTAAAGLPYFCARRCAYHRG